ncbi:Uncharacterised protein [Mycobacteroides abscessus subsp. abscessus]|nr:Uncharacterised protein [Mycobacteroides abscessus subsp. abscessus]
MGFKVRFQGRADETEGQWYEYLDGGVLAIHFGNERWSEYYPPGVWVQLTTDQQPGPLPPDPAAWSPQIY